MSEPLVVGVDVGGTKVVAAVVDSSGTCRTVARALTPSRDVDALEAGIARLVDDALAGSGHRGRPDAVGLSAAGFVDASGGTVAFAPHLPWRDAPVRDRLGARWGVPVALENDATCAMVAESVHGAARGRDSAVLLTLGTGIGGGLVSGGQVVRGAGGMAGEFGHMCVEPVGRPCPCGGRGCWEQYCSGRALLREARERWGAAPSCLEVECGGDPARLTGQQVTAAARRGDAFALSVVATVATWLAHGVSNLVAVLDPEVVLVGGGLGDAHDLLLGPASRQLEARVVGAGHRTVPPLLPATTGHLAGLVGAAVLARRLLD